MGHENGGYLNSDQRAAEREAAAAIRRDADRYRAIRGSKHLSWGYDGCGVECVKAELPLAGEPIWKDENAFDFVANFDAAADALVAKSQPETSAQ